LKAIMNFISYAPNFEDILLWRALRGIEPGFYIDAGAADPLHGSVTQAFYQRGWRGINLEPAPALHARLAAARPADINLALGAVAPASAAGNATLPFYDALDSQRATFVPAQAQASRAAGLQVMQREAAVTTLAEVCRQHAADAGAIHFLNVAVSGAEADALAGMDWQQWRPWIVLVQTNDGADAAAVAAQMQAARYALAYHDGHKNYYVAQEQAALAAALALPPHEGDAFTLYEGHHYAHPLDQWRSRTAAAEQAAADADAWAKAHEQGWTERATHAEVQLMQARKDKEHTETTLNRLLQDATARAAHAEAQAAHEAANGRRVEAELAAIYASRAWKLSKPIRGMVKLARYARNRLRHSLWRVKHAVAQLRAKAKGALLAPVKALVKCGLHFVTSRPALAFFLRRQIGRFPRLVGLLRAVAMRAKAQPVATDPAGVVSTDIEHLPSAARHVFDDLQRAMQRSRNPSGPQ
jgi:FkbM family methyltransferase